MSDDVEVAWLFEIQATKPGKTSGPSSYRRNITAHVVTTDFATAFRLFTEQHPDAEVNGMQRRNRTENVVIDPALVRETVIS